MSDVTVVQTPKGHTTIHYKGKMLATISGAGITREDRIKYAKIMASSLEHHNSNTAAMLEALNKVGNAAAWIAESCDDQQTAKYMNDIIAIVQSALSAPARNCDALSADDVKSRFKERMASSDMGLIGENIVEVVSGVVDFLYATEKGGEEGGAK